MQRKQKRQKSKAGIAVMPAPGGLEPAAAKTASMDHTAAHRVIWETHNDDNSASASVLIVGSQIKKLISPLGKSIQEPFHSVPPQPGTGMEPSQVYSWRCCKCGNRGCLGQRACSACHHCHCRHCVGSLEV